MRSRTSRDRSPQDDAADRLLSQSVLSAREERGLTYPVHTERAMSAQRRRLVSLAASADGQAVSLNRHASEDVAFLLRIAGLRSSEALLAQMWADGWTLRQIRDVTGMPATTAGVAVRRSLAALAGAGGVTFGAFSRRSVYRAPSRSAALSVVPCASCGQPFLVAVNAPPFCTRECRAAKRRTTRSAKSP